MLELVRLVLGGLALLHSEAEGGYFPVYEQHTELRPGDGSYRYPDHDDVSTSPNYFISQLNFDILNGTLVTGAANRLFFLNSTTLSPIHIYQWNATKSNEDSCRNPSGSEETSDPDYVCNNHIRLYRKLPSNSSQVLVCGTQAVVQPQCRILEISISEGGTISINSNAAVVASDGLVSYYPQFSQFGEFRNSYDSDPVFLTAGFFVGGNTGVARHFSISYKNITMTTPSDPSTLETTELFRTINDNNNWLRFPVTFVGVHKADYDPSFSPTNRGTDYQFWFVFLRENLVSGNVVYSRLVRICRNDPGSNTTSGGAYYFTTYMKARIFCKRDKPSSLESTASLDFIYNSITSFVFSERGRYYGDSTPQKLLYGSFTGPSNGPVGSALCVYPADNSLETGSPDGHTRSVFDIFREDIGTDPTSSPFENKFLECDPEGRVGERQQRLFIKSDVSVAQIGDPILILDDVVVTHMVQDSVCVVTRDDSSKCINQDVLFLGLDSGRVLKVVLRTDDKGDSDPVIAENIELDAGDPRAITALELRELDEEKFLFVATETRVYKLPLQRCSHFNCSECVSSRDPYCLYNTKSNLCEPNDLSETGTVDIRYRQNIHTGAANDCPPLIPNNGSIYSEVELIVFLTNMKCTNPLEMGGDFTSQLVEEVVTSLQSKCVSCDFSSDDIINVTLFLSCSDKDVLAISLQGTILSANLTLSALPEGSEVTVGGQKLTVVCVATGSSTSCAPPTSGVSSSEQTTYHGEFVAILVLFLLTIVGGLIVIVILLLYCYRQSIHRAVTDLCPHTAKHSLQSTQPTSDSEPPSTVPLYSTHPTASPGNDSQATPTGTSSTSPRHKIAKALSYQEAQNTQIETTDGVDPQSSLTPLIRRTIKSEEPRPDFRMSQNTAYDQCGDGVKMKDKKGEGEGERDASTDPTV